MLRYSSNKEALVMKNRGGFASKAVGTFFTLSAVSLLNFITNLILARVLGPAGKGIITPAMNIASIVIALASLGLGNSVAFFIDKPPFKAKDVLLTSTLVSLLTGLIAAFCTWMTISLTVVEATAITKTFFSGGTFFTVVYTTTQSCLLGRNRIGVMNIINLISSFVRTALCTILLYLIWPSVEGFALAYFAAQTLNAILTTILSFRETGVRGAEFDVSFLIKAISFTIAVYLARIALETNATVGVILLKQFRPPDEVGLLSQAMTVSNLLMLIPQALAMALYGAVVGEKNKEQFAARAIRLSLIATFVIAIILAATAPWLIPILFKKAFTPSIPFLWALLPATVVYTIPQLYTSLLIASWGKPWHFFSASAIALCVNLLGNILLLSHLGPWATVVAFSASVLAMTVYYIILLVRKGGLRFSEIFIPRLDDFRILLQRLKTI